MTDTGHWVYNTDFDPEEFFGFVYIITNNTNDMKYLGRKQFGTYKKRKRIKESNWKKYSGSSKSLAAAIKEDGKENFTFDIFRLYTTRGGLVYWENYYLYKFNVLTLKDDQGEFVYYNKHIGSIKFRPPFEISEETRYKMSQSQKKRVITDEHRSNLSTAWKNSIPSQENLKRMSESNIGRVRSEETRKRMSKSQTGLKHSRADQTIYKFIHGYHGVEELTQYDLCIKYNLKTGSTSKIVKGKQKCIYGWMLLKEAKDEG